MLIQQMIMTILLLVCGVILGWQMNEIYKDFKMINREEREWVVIIVFIVSKLGTSLYLARYIATKHWEFSRRSMENKGVNISLKRGKKWTYTKKY